MEKEIQVAWPVIVKTGNPPEYLVVREDVEKPHQATRFDVHAGDYTVGTPGHIKQEENLVEAAVRESREESGCGVAIDGNLLIPIGIINCDFCGGFFPVQVFLALIGTEDISKSDPQTWESTDRETKPVGWMTADKIRALKDERRFRGGALTVLDLAERALTEQSLLV